MKLYSMKQAVNPQRVRIFLAEKGVTVQTVNIDIPSGENRSPEFLKVNPRGLIPALVLEDGTVIGETMAICRYIEELHPEPALFGTTAKEKALVEMRQREVEWDGLLPVAWIFRNSAPQFAGRSQPGAVPDMEQLPALVERGRILANIWLERLNDILSEAEFVAGDSFSVADISALTTIGFAKWVKITIPEDHQHSLRWYKAVKARPSAGA